LGTAFIALLQYRRFFAGRERDTVFNSHRTTTIPVE
jgi:hypothetical protein